MNALLDHKWRQSPAQDAIWAQVAGMRPSRAVRQLLMALQFRAFLDESVSGPEIPEGEFVLAGHIATAEQWARFSKEWEELLPWGGILEDDGQYNFHMTEMAASPERLSRVRAFYRVIEDNVALSVSFRINLHDFANAKARFRAMTEPFGISFGFADWDNPYYFSFRTFMDTFHSRRGLFDKVIPLDETVDFYFDDKVEKSIIFNAWNDYQNTIPEQNRKYYGATPRFENDRDRRFLPLQAADLWAWYVREWYEEDCVDVPDKMKAFDFGGWTGKQRPSLTIVMSENQILDRLKELSHHIDFIAMRGNVIWNKDD
jgi:hypothetical protein